MSLSDTLDELDGKIESISLHIEGVLQRLALLKDILEAGDEKVEDYS